MPPARALSWHPVPAQPDPKLSPAAREILGNLGPLPAAAKGGQTPALAGKESTHPAAPTGEQGALHLPFGYGPTRRSLLRSPSLPWERENLLKTDGLYRHEKTK